MPEVKTNNTTLDLVIKSLGGISIMIFILSNIPQIRKMKKTKKTQGISMSGFFIYLFGLTLAQIYACYFELWELVIPNSLQFFLAIYKMYLKRKYDQLALLEDELLLDKQIVQKYNNSIDEELTNEFNMDNNILKN